jgi:hypothetical protein
MYLNKSNKKQEYSITTYPHTICTNGTAQGYKVPSMHIECLYGTYMWVLD